MLTAVAVCSVDEAVPLTGAGVGRIVLLTPSEETLITRQQRVCEHRRTGSPGEHRSNETGFDETNARSLTLHPSHVMTP